MHRLFVALDLPDAIKDQLVEVAKGVPGVKWVGREQMHLTLRFIGEVDDAQLAAAQAALAGVRAAPFDMLLKGVGQFPPRGAARVLWVGVAPAPGLTALQRGVEAAISGAQLPPADKPFAAHITLGRVRTSPQPMVIGRYLNQHAAFETPPIPAREFALYASRLSPHGPSYTRLAAFPLAGD